MTRKAEIVSINCTSCGAGLSVFGGGRVQTHVCGYCGSQLDAQDDYKVLQKFAGLERPDSPFHIGMKGRVRGVAYTVIGTLGFEERYAGRVWRWVDHQLYSPTHGYAFLTVEKGHFIFSRAFRKSTNPRWLGASMLNSMEHRPSVSADGTRYRYYDSGRAVINFAEGEFNWKPKIGDASSTVSLMSDDAVLGFSRTDTEEEIIRSVYPDQTDIAKSFGLEWMPALQGVHRLQPFNAGPHDRFIRRTALAAMVFCALTYVILLGLAGGKQTEMQQLTAGEFPVSIPFEVTQPQKVARLQLEGNFNNDWTYFEIAISGPDGVPVFETGRTISFYSGRDSEGSWSEGSRSSTLRFRPNVAGTHTLEIGVGGQDNTNAFSRLTVRISEGALVARWFLFAALFFGLVWAVPAFRYARHQRARWLGMDWNED